MRSHHGFDVVVVDGLILNGLVSNATVILFRMLEVLNYLMFASYDCERTYNVVQLYGMVSATACLQYHSECNVTKKCRVFLKVSNSTNKWNDLLCVKFFWIGTCNSRGTIHSKKIY